jgi:FtsH-binding integral membrane protein
VSTQNPSAAFGSEAIAERGFLRQVFTWMFLALALTTGIAIWFHHVVSIAYLDNHQTLFVVAIGAQFVFAIVFSRSLSAQRMPVQVAALQFFLFAALTGAVFSILIDTYTTKSIVGAFAGAAGVFAGMALVGYTTRTDLSRLRPLIMGAWVGIVAASIAYLFVGGGIFNLVIGYAGVIVFSAFTAYYMQRLKALRAQGFATADSEEKLAIMAAFTLYLAFINLFISLLRIFGGNR